MARTTTDTKEKLLDVAQGLIQRHGINAMSFQDLSDAVGIRKASVHHHFANKAEMVKALCRRQLIHFGRQLQAILNSRTNAKTKLKRYCGLFAETLEAGDHDCGCMFGMLMADLLSLDNECRDYVGQFTKLNTDFIEQVLNVGSEDGSLSELKNVKVTARLIFATVEGGLLVARTGDGSRQLTQTTNRLIELLNR